MFPKTIESVAEDLSIAKLENRALREENANLRLELDRAKKRIKEIVVTLNESRYPPESAQRGADVLKVHAVKPIPAVLPMATREDDQRLEAVRE